MNLEQRLSDDLPALPPELVPPPDLADTVLRDLRRQRRTRGLVAALAASVLVIGAPITVSQLPSGEGPQIVGEDPIAAGFPTPGGGPQAIHLYLTDDPTFRAFLLDPETGDYREFPFEYASLSPDLSTLAIVDEQGAGVADRAALLREGVSAITRFGLGPAGPPAWSPDGTAVLFTTLDRADGIRFTAHRYDLAAAAVTDSTSINVEIIGSSVGWAADSTNYLALLRGVPGTDTVEPGALQYIDPDGTLGEQIQIQGGMVGGAEAYAGDHLLLDNSGIMSEERVPSRVLDLETGDVVATLQGRPIGWYDQTTVVQQRGKFLEVLNLETGSLVRRVNLAGLPRATWIQIGSSSEVPEDYGF